MTNYDKAPRVVVGDDPGACLTGWPDILARLPAGRIVVECYPGVAVDGIIAAIRDARPASTIIATPDLFRASAAIAADLAPILTDDRVFARFAPLDIDFYLDHAKVVAARDAMPAAAIVVGPGAALVAQGWDALVMVSLARWELQLRQRDGRIGNLGLDNAAAGAAEKYKCAYFIDWRVGDRIKVALLDRIDWLIDANAATPRMISGRAWRAALHLVARQPFRVVPFFDPGPWGGQWMRERFDLPSGPPNYAWCFDCVPEENSLLLGFGGTTVEVPAIDVVFAEPEALLGEHVVAQFGAEFPIRFDFLDTVGGGNLSLQVHPQRDYARRSFGLPYTQDESYYLLDAASDAVVYLGVRDDSDPASLVAELQAAQAGGPAFAVERHVNAWPAKKHDHFLIPAGTIHCSGAGAMVLEVSATPYVFTFKLWDWGRVGLDGRPRPIHLERGAANIDWGWTTSSVARDLINRIEVIAETGAYRIERTGLHGTGFIDTDRAWFTGPVPFETGGGVNVLNLVDGDAAIVESPIGAFAPFTVHYAETFIVPAAVGSYTIRPAGLPAAPLAVIRAQVRRAPDAEAIR